MKCRRLRWRSRTRRSWCWRKCRAAAQPQAGSESDWGESFHRSPCLGFLSPACLPFLPLHLTRSLPPFPPSLPFFLRLERASYALADCRAPSSQMDSGSQRKDRGARSLEPSRDAFVSGRAQWQFPGWGSWPHLERKDPAMPHWQTESCPCPPLMCLISNTLTRRMRTRSGAAAHSPPLRRTRWTLCSLTDTPWSCPGPRRRSWSTFEWLAPGRSPGQKKQVRHGSVSRSSRLSAAPVISFPRGKAPSPSQSRKAGVGVAGGAAEPADSCAPP